MEGWPQIETHISGQGLGDIFCLVVESTVLQTTIISRRDGIALKWFHKITTYQIMLYKLTHLCHIMPLILLGL